jgi:hypothetical protein
MIPPVDNEMRHDNKRQKVPMRNATVMSRKNNSGTPLAFAE